MDVRHFANLPSCPTLESAHAEMRDRSSTHAAGFWAIDGLRLCAEIPEHVADAMIVEAERRRLVDAAELEKIAAGWKCQK